MNYKLVFFNTGKVVLTESVMLLICSIISFIYGEIWTACSFIISAIIALSLGLLAVINLKNHDGHMYAKEGFITVSISWIILSVIGSFPFIISGTLGFFDAIFESVSGFTTTGASVIADVDAIGKGLIFWRSFTHFIGGMGIIVFVVAITAKTDDRSINVLKAEMPGPVVDKLVPKSKNTARILYRIYVGMTLIMAVLLFLGGNDVFNSIVISLGTAGTGGFSPTNAGIGGLNAYSQWIVAVFMFLFGINFNLYYLLLMGKIKQCFKSSELWLYIGIVLVSVAVITGNLMYVGNYTVFSDALRDSTFQVCTIISTTGYATKNFEVWPSVSKAVLFVLMFIGGCAGSTAGGFKISRIGLLGRGIKREIRKVVQPRTVRVVMVDGKKVEDGTVSSVGLYLALYLAFLFVAFLLISFDGFSLLTNFSACVVCLNNVGPGFAGVGPMETYASYSAFSKVVLSLTMLFGRLEIYPLLLTFLPSTWIKR